MTDKIKTEDTKLEAIVCAAQKRFAHYGLCKTTMNEIATDVGMGKASLYYYFPDKETLFEAVIIKEQNVFFDEMYKIVNSGIEASAQLKKFVKLRSHYFKQCLNLSKLRSDVFNNSRPIYVKAFENFRKEELEIVKNILQNGINNKEFKRINKQEYAEFLVQMLLGLRLVKVKYKDVNDWEQADYDDLEKQAGKVAGMFLKDIQTE